MDVLADGATDNEAELLAEVVDLGVAGLVDELEPELSSSSLTTCSRRFLHRSNRSWAVMAGIKMLTKKLQNNEFLVNRYRAHLPSAAENASMFGVDWREVFKSHRTLRKNKPNIAKTNVERKVSKNLKKHCVKRMSNLRLDKRMLF